MKKKIDPSEETMKKNKLAQFKPLLLALILAVAGFVLIFSELISMYANNTNDFWFDLSVLFGPALLLSAIPTLAVFVILACVFFITKHFKKLKIYYIIFALFSCAFVVCYIHANFLSSMLPSLDGTEINWSSIKANIISIVVTLATLASVIFLIIKFKPEKTAKIINYVNLAIIAMLLVSLFTTFLTTDIFAPKELTVVSSTKNINLLSNEENFTIFMVDAVDAKTFEDVLNSDGGRSDELKDFTYFPDSISGYPFTRDSVPFILSGVWNENEKPFAEWSTETLDNAKLFSELSEKNYKVKNFYDNDFTWQSRKAFEFDNLESIDKDINVKHFVVQELKYLLFKVLPFPLKKYSKIDNMKFDESRISTDYETFIWDDNYYYYNTLQNDAEFTDDKVFSFLHLEGGHVPHNLNKKVEVVESGTNYRTKVQATLTVIKGYINYLKENGAYDNSTIVILADHGFNADNGVPGRQNPILLVKSKNETHSGIHTSDKQVSFADLSDMYTDLLNGKKSTEIFSNLPSDGRERRYIFYKYTMEDHMVEQTTTGKAWETDKLIPTGKEFNR